MNDAAFPVGQCLLAEGPGCVDRDFILVEHPSRRAIASIGGNRHRDSSYKSLGEWPAITRERYCLRQEPWRMEEAVEGRDPKKCQVNHKPRPIMRDSKSCCCSKPTHAEGTEDRNRKLPRHQRLANEDADGGNDIHDAIQSHHGRKGADDVRTGLTQAQVVGVEKVFRRQYESHPGSH